MAPDGDFQLRYVRSFLREVGEGLFRSISSKVTTTSLSVNFVVV